MERNTEVITAALSLFAASTVLSFVALKSANEDENGLAVAPPAFVARRTSYEDNNDQPYDPIGFDPTQPGYFTNRAQRGAAQYGHTIRTFSTRLG